MNDASLIEKESKDKNEKLILDSIIFSNLQSLSNILCRLLFDIIALLEISANVSEQTIKKTDKLKNELLEAIKSTKNELLEEIKSTKIELNNSMTAITEDISEINNKYVNLSKNLMRLEKEYINLNSKFSTLWDRIKNLEENVEELKTLD